MLVTANIFQPLIDVFQSVLIFFHNHVGVSWGFSIVLLTICIRAIMIPLTLKQFKSMRALQTLQPEMKALQNKYKDKGLVVLGLDQDDGMAVKEVAAASKRVGVTYPILLGDSGVDKAYGDPDVLPMSFYVNKAGSVVEVTAGLGSKDQLEAMVKEVIGAK